MPDTIDANGLPIGTDFAEKIDPEDPAWDEVYEYGAFAFGNFQADLTEGATDGWETVMLPVYRLGGTIGRAEVRIHYEPAATKIAEGQDMAITASMDMEFNFTDYNKVPADAFKLPDAE